MFKITPFEFTYKVFGSPENDAKKIFSNEKIEISRNGLYVISGESGAGKSTFLNLLKGIAPHFIPGDLKGEFYFDNELLTESSIEQFKDKIVYLFQNPFSQIIHQDVNLEFAFTLENLKVTPDFYLKAKEKLGVTFNLNHLWHKKSHQLSNGECQKLVLASLIALSPKVILLDEPTAFLDPVSRFEFYQIVKELKKSHIVILVDHHLKEIKEMVDEYFWIDQSGEIQNIIEMPSEKSNLDEQFDFPLVNDSFEVAVNNLSFNYPREINLYHDINLNFKNNEVVVIKGKNGQGKSTLFKLMTKILKPDKGNVEYFKNGKKLSEKDIRKHVGFVFQNPESNFFFNTLKEELQGGDDRLVMRFFTNSELNRSPYLFSEGQKRRISILISLILNKSILFLDEPTFGQDQKNKMAIAKIINSLKNQGYLIIIISHDEEFIANVATSVYELNDRRLNAIK